MYHTTVMSREKDLERSAIHPPSWIGWSMWALGSLLFAVGFFQRTAPAVMTAELMSDFHLTAASLGNLASFYFYAYVITQIPTGVITAVYGTRRLLTWGFLATGAGTLIFAVAGNYSIAAIGLLMVGGSVGVAMVLTLELIGRWLPKERFAMASGMTIAAGVLGAMMAGYPLRLMISSFGWRPIMLSIGMAVLILSAFVWLLVRDDPRDRGYVGYTEKPKVVTSTSPWRKTFSGLKAVFAYRNTWIMILAPGSLIGALLSFSGLWGVGYLKTRFGLASEHGALICTLLLASFAAASPVIGIWSDRLGSRKSLYAAGYFLATSGWLILILTHFELNTFIAVLIMTGFATGTMPLSYAVGRESVPSELSSQVTGVVITGIMVGPAIVQPITGWLLDYRWSGVMESGVRVYGPDAYRFAFLPMLVWSIVACLLVVTIQEKKQEIGE